MYVHVRTEHQLLPFRPDMQQGKLGILENLLKSAFYQSSSDLAAWYSRKGTSRNYILIKSLGAYDVPEKILSDWEWLDFIHHCRESLVLNKAGKSFLDGILIHPVMKSGYVIPLFENTQISDIVILNSRATDSYGRKNCCDLHSLSMICSDLLF